MSVQDLQNRLNEAVGKYNAAHEELRELESKSRGLYIEFTSAMVDAAEKCKGHLEEMQAICREMDANGYR